MIVRLNQARVMTFGNPDDPNHIRLLPGANNVPATKWKTWSKNPVIAKMVEEDELSEEQEASELEAMSKTQEDAEAFNYLLTQKPPGAKAIVEKTVDLPLLEEWMKRETRNVVKGALKKQIDVLKAPPEYRSGNGVSGVDNNRGDDKIDLGMVKPTAEDGND